MVQTSYFSSKAPRERKVSIARKSPGPLYGDRHVPELAPWNLDPRDWRRRYRRHLEEQFRDPEDLRRLLATIEAAVPHPILCCYEKDPAQCHRGVVARFIEAKLGIIVPEWQPGGE
jgi:hypothetical protein